MSAPNNGDRKIKESLQELEWLDEDEKSTSGFVSRFEIFKRNMLKNPLVPLGLLATTTVLGLGMANVAKNGPLLRSQYLMRWRVGLQSATVAAFTLGILYEQYLKDEKRKSIWSSE